MNQSLRKFYCFSLILSLAAVMLVLVSCSAETFTKSDNNKSVDLKLNEIIEIRLESNITTGYDWSIGQETDLGIVAVILDQYKPSAVKLAGSGGIHVYRFKAVSAGQTKIILNYERPWEENVDPIEIYEINVNVK